MRRRSSRKKLFQVRDRRDDHVISGGAASPVTIGEVMPVLPAQMHDSVATGAERDKTISSRMAVNESATGPAAFVASFRFQLQFLVAAVEMTIYQHLFAVDSLMPPASITTRASRHISAHAAAASLITAHYFQSDELPVAARR